jgi:hypothetical protein
VVLAKERFGPAPDLRRFAERIQRELNAADAAGQQFGNEVFRIRRLQRPTAHGQTFCHKMVVHADLG